MSKLLNRFWLGGLGIALLLGGVIAAVPVTADDDEGEVEISAEDLPVAIREALEGVEIEDADRITRRDVVIYEVAIEVDDAEIELQLTSEARLVGVEVEEEEGDDDSEEDDDDDEEDEDEDDDEDDDDDE